MAEAEVTGVEQFGLTHRALEPIRGVFRRHPEVREVRIFGSRAMGCFEKQSDVDMALWPDLDPTLIARMFAELDELPLPYTFDVKAYDSITHVPLKRHIDEHSQLLYTRETS